MSAIGAKSESSASRIFPVNRSRSVKWDPSSRRPQPRVRPGAAAVVGWSPGGLGADGRRRPDRSQVLRPGRVVRHHPARLPVPGEHDVCGRCATTRQLRHQPDPARVGGHVLDAGGPGRRTESQPHHLRRERHDAVRRGRLHGGPQCPDRHRRPAPRRLVSHATRRAYTGALDTSTLDSTARALNDGAARTPPAPPPNGSWRDTTARRGTAAAALAGLFGVELDAPPPGRRHGPDGCSRPLWVWIPRVGRRAGAFSLGRRETSDLVGTRRRCTGR